MTRCWCGRPAPHDSACGCCCAEHDEGNDGEQFCPVCFAGMESNEHREKCVFPAEIAEDNALTVARVRALVTEHPDSQVPVVRLDDLRRALGDDE